MTTPILALLLVAGFQAPGKPEEDLVNLVQAYLGKDLPMDWDGLESLPGTKWAALPPRSLTNCLPDGGCYTRQGTATLGGRAVTVMTSGARTMVQNLYLRNAGAPFGEPAVVAALRRADSTSELVRCPVKGGRGSTNWYRVKGAKSAGFLSIQTVRGERPSEGYVISYGTELPKLQPNQLAMYSLQCTPGAEQKPVSTALPHQALAEVVNALLVPASSQGHDWASLRAVQAGIVWDTAAPKRWDLTTLRNDPSPVAISGHAEYADRKFSALASGTATQV